jgi:hypothetical protein
VSEPRLVDAAEAERALPAPLMMMLSASRRPLASSRRRVQAWLAWYFAVRRQQCGVYAPALPLA